MPVLCMCTCVGACVLVYFALFMMHSCCERHHQCCDPVTSGECLPPCCGGRSYRWWVVKRILPAGPQIAAGDFGEEEEVAEDGQPRPKKGKKKRAARAAAEDESEEEEEGGGKGKARGLVVDGAPGNTVRGPNDLGRAPFHQ